MRTPIDPIETHIRSIDRILRELQEHRKALVRLQRKQKLTEDMVELLRIIDDNPGIERSAILKLMKISPNDYINKMTSLRRRNMIINLGTRKAPRWYIV